MTPRHEQPTPAIDIAKALAAHIPVLETERLSLRAPRLSDFDPYTMIVCTERGRYVDGPYSREDGWFDFLSLTSGWILHGHGGWAIEDIASGTLLGFVALGLEPGDREVELGYLLLEAAEGHGFATEAAVSARNWSFDVLKLKTLVSYIDERNERSIALAHRIGAFDDTPDDFPKGSRMFRHLPHEVHA